MIHIYQGTCPDEITGPDSRDPECPACMALDTKDAEIARLTAENAALWAVVDAAEDFILGGEMPADEVAWRAAMAELLGAYQRPG